MTKLPAGDEQADWRAWYAACRAGGDVDLQLREIYAALDRRIAEKSPTCWVSGKCCHFDTYGHRLYVTGLEIAWLLRRLEDEHVAWPRDPEQLLTLDGCAFQVDGKCGVHALRPLGCRIYFCDPNAQGWQNPLYELFMTDLRSLHETQGLPYFYGEWRHGLRAGITSLQ